MRKQKIIIVDNNEDIKQLYEIAFAASEFEMVFFTSSLKALRHLDRNEVDAVLIDLAMPEMDGLIFAEWLRINEDKTGGRHHARLAWFTGMEITAADNRVGDRTDVETFFKKPTDPFTLIGEIKTWLSKPPPYFSKQTVIVGNQNGAVLPTMTAAIIGVVVLILVIAVYNSVLHKREEEAAYRYSDKRNELSQMTTICNANWEKSAALAVWLGQQNIKPPPELLVWRMCAVTNKEE